MEIPTQSCFPGCRRHHAPAHTGDMGAQLYKGGVGVHRRNYPNLDL